MTVMRALASPTVSVTTVSPTPHGVTVILPSAIATVATLSSDDATPSSAGSASSLSI